MNLDPSMMTPQMQAMLQAAVDTANKELERARIPFAVALALVIWEILATFHLEYERIWRRKWNFVTLCFMVCRWFTPLSLTLSLYLNYWPSGSAEDCSHIVKWVNVAPMITFLSAAGLLGTRVYAVWQQNKVILAILLSLAGLEVGVQIAAFAHSHAVQLPPPVRACLPDANSQHLLWAYFATVAVYDVVTLVLSLIKTFTVSKDGPRSRVLQVIVRDQLVFFGLCCAVNVSNIIVFAVIDPSKNRSIMSPIAIAITSIAANRMLLNVRGAAQETTSNLSSTASFPLSSFQKSQQVSVTMPSTARQPDQIYTGFYDERKGRSVETLRA